MNGLLLISLVALLAAFALGAIDGMYFHLKRYQLFAHPESRGEHALHTVRAFLVMPPLALLYLAEPSGLYLWVAAASIAADQIALALDVRAEATSRRRFGGLSAEEYQIHIAANGLHSVALALALASRPVHAWSLAATSLHSSSFPLTLQVFLGVLLLAAAVGAIQHVALLFGRHADTATAERAH
jgi:hypothetical protein